MGPLGEMSHQSVPEKYPASMSGEAGKMSKTQGRRQLGTRECNVENNNGYLI